MSPAKPREPGASETATQLRGLTHDRAGVVSGTWKTIGEIREGLPHVAAGATGLATAASPTSSSPIVPAAKTRHASSARMPVAQRARAPERVRIVKGEAPAEPAMVSIRARCHDDLLEYTHNFVGSYTRSRFRAALADSLSVATFELLGNALNYGSAMGDVVFEIVERPSAIAVCVSNDTVQVRIDMLSSQLERIGRDPEATFLEEMRRSTVGGISRPMLGLARVVHESKMTVDLYISGARVTVAASSPM